MGAYHCRHAPEYDDWFYQRGHYDQEERVREEWLRENEVASSVLRSLGPVDDALELAC